MLQHALPYFGSVMSGCASRSLVLLCNAFNYVWPLSLICLTNPLLWHTMPCHAFTCPCPAHALYFTVLCIVVLYFDMPFCTFLLALFVYALPSLPKHCPSNFYLPCLKLFVPDYHRLPPLGAPYKLYDYPNNLTKLLLISKRKMHARLRGDRKRKKKRAF